MKKIIFIILFIFLFLIMIDDSSDSDELRFRVIANSDTSYDQELKMKVVRYLNKEDINIDKLELIKNKAQYIILSNNYSYNVSVTVKKQKYETKYYGNKIIQGGVYNSIVVTIGEGKGKNYWTILYPEYFGVSFEDINTGNVTYDIWIVKKIKELFK